MNMFNKQVSLFEEDDIEEKRKFFEALKTALRTCSTSFVLQFLEKDGLVGILNFLSSMDSKTKTSGVHTLLLGCIKAIMNVPEGRRKVIESQKAVSMVAQATVVDNIRTKTSALEILGALCLVPGGHKKVLYAMNHLASYANERVRFQSLISDLCKHSDSIDQDAHFKIAILSFINAALKYGAGDNSLEFRLHLRYEFLMLGLGAVLENLRELENESILKHVEFFERFRLDDEEAIAKRFQVDHIDCNDVDAMLSLIRNKLYASEAYPEFMSTLLHMCLMPFGSARNVCYWRVLNKFTQQLVLQKEDGANPDMEICKMNFADILDHLKAEQTEITMEQQLKSLQKKCDELTEALKEAQELAASNSKACAPSGVVPFAVPHPPPVPGFPGAMVPPPPPPPMTSSPRAPPPPPVAPIPGLSGPRPPPPPPLMSNGPPGGPPPPPMPGMGPAGPMAAMRRKNIPKSSNPLKSLNWSKLPENKISGTVWSDLDDEQVFKVIDLSEFDRQFSAYQKPDEDYLPDQKRHSQSKTTKELSLIDGRRSQNCVILLHRMKLTNEELLQILLKMDSDNEIPSDLLDEILKFTPTPEEITLLEEHKHKYSQMARADRYFFDLGQLGRYNERLSCLVFKKKFFHRIGEANPNLDCIIESAKKVRFSKKLQKILEYVLAFGNYMNKGARGNAYGFKLEGLTKVVDTKSSLDKSVTLLHYIIDVCGSKSPEILDIPEELQIVKKASRVLLSEQEEELNSLRGGIKKVEKELEHYKKNPIKNPADMFVKDMTDFLVNAHREFSELEEKTKEAQDKYKKAAKHFGEDPSKMTSDMFFRVFDTFITSFEEVQTDLKRRKDRAREDEEKEKRAATIAASQSKGGKTAGNASAGVGGKTKNEGTNKSGEFDELISALQSGDVFLEDLNKMKRTARRKGQPNPNSLCIPRESLGGY